MILPFFLILFFYLLPDLPPVGMRSAGTSITWSWSISTFYPVLILLCWLLSNKLSKLYFDFFHSFCSLFGTCFGGSLCSIWWSFCDLTWYDVQFVYLSLIIFILLLLWQWVCDTCVCLICVANVNSKLVKQLPGFLIMLYPSGGFSNLANYLWSSCLQHRFMVPVLVADH